MDTLLVAVGSFVGRADDQINLRGVKMFPSQIEEAVRSVDGTGDEFEIVLATNPDGLPVMEVRVTSSHLYSIRNSPPSDVASCLLRPS